MKNWMAVAVGVLALAAWMPLTGTLFATGAQLTVVDPGVGAASRFYRVVQVD